MQNSRDITDHIAQDFGLLQRLVEHLLVADRISFIKILQDEIMVIHHFTQARRE